MAISSVRRFVITFRDQYPLDLIDVMAAGNFMGWGNVHRSDDPRTVFLDLFPNISREMFKVDLDEMQAAGELTYVEQSP